MRRRELLIALGMAGLPPGRRFVEPLGRVLAMAAPERPVPSAAQLAWQRDELALFLHFGVNTFTDREWGDGTEDPRIFDPAALDTRQWTRAAKAGGFRTLILTAKHHDGFCLWPTETTAHSVRSSPWREGRGDVVREMVDACRADGVGVGLYLSPWDRHEPSYGDSPRYNDLYARQLTELLTRYGPLVEVWFDGANGEGPNGRRQEYDWPRVHRLVRELQPSALIFSDAGPDIRWIGNERGTAGDPNWCTVDPATVPYPGMSGDHIIRALQHGDPHGTVWRPGEADVSIRPGWFWHPAEDPAVRSPDDLVDLYLSSIGRNAGLLLNVPPTTRGLLHDADVRALAGFGQRLADLFAVDHASTARATASGSASGASTAARVLDPDPDTYWAPPTGASEAAPWVELEWLRPVAVDVVCIQEAIAQGQHVAAHTLEAWDGRGWTPLARGRTIGHKRIHRVPTLRTTRLRLTITSALATPRIARLTVHRTSS
jgi:alpha-L-fucosidase